MIPSLRSPLTLIFLRPFCRLSKLLIFAHLQRKYPASNTKEWESVVSPSCSPLKNESRSTQNLLPFPSNYHVKNFLLFSFIIDLCPQPSPPSPPYPSPFPMPPPPPPSHSFPSHPSIHPSSPPKPPSYGSPCFARLPVSVVLLTLWEGRLIWEEEGEEKGGRRGRQWKGRGMGRVYLRGSLKVGDARRGGV